MGEHRATKRPGSDYDVALVVRTPRGRIIHPFTSKCKSMGEVKEIASALNMKTEVVDDRPRTAVLPRCNPLG